MRIRAQNAANAAKCEQTTIITFMTFIALGDVRCSGATDESAASHTYDMCAPIRSCAGVDFAAAIN